MDWEDESDTFDWDEEWESGNIFWHNDMIMTSDLYPFVELD